MLRRRSSTNRFFLFVSKALILSPALLAIFVVWVEASRNRNAEASKTPALAQDPQPTLVEGDHYVYGATYSIKAFNRSTLALNNPMMTRTRSVRVTLYNKAGHPLELTEVTLAPAQTKFVNIRDLITPDQLGAFQRGQRRNLLSWPSHGNYWST